MPLDHVPGFTLDRIRPQRLRRMLAVARMRQANMSHREIQAAIDIARNTLRADIRCVNLLGADAILEQLEKIDGPIPEPEPADKRRGTCQRTIVVSGRARICGTPCDGQLCDDCRPLTAPIGGARWPGGKAQSKTGRF